MRRKFFSGEDSGRVENLFGFDAGRVCSMINVVVTH